MIQIRRSVLRDAEALHALQKEAFLPLYERYHDAGNRLETDPGVVLASYLKRI